MSNSSTRVPRTIQAFNDYITSTNDRLQAINPATSNTWWKDYGLTSSQADEWKARRDKWVNEVFATYSNPVTSTSIAKADTQTFMNDFREFANPILNLIEVSPLAGNAEEHIFNFVLHRKNPTRPTTPIHDECVVSIIPEGRGTYEFSCKSTSDGGRASKVHGADSIQFAYSISTGTPNPMPVPEDPSMIRDLATTAIFHHDFGAENQGRWLTIYFRWYNTKHPNLAGPWSAVQSVAIG